MPPIDPVKNFKLKTKRKTKAPAKPKYHVTVPDAKEETRSRAPRRVSKPLSGDAPQTRKSDTAKADKYKQSQAYVDKFQKARTVHEAQKFEKDRGYKPPGKTDDSFRKVMDKAYFQTHTRVPDAKPAAPKPKPKADPKRFMVDGSTGRATVIPDPPKPQPKPKPDQSQADEPRSDKEVRKFLKDGKRPRSVKKKDDSPFAQIPGFKNIPPQIATVINPGAKVPKVGAMAASLLIGKEAARPLHASAAALEGKNPIKGFKSGHDTGSDVLRHYHADKVLGKYGTAAVGFALDSKIDPLNKLKVNFRSPKEALERKAASLEARGKTAAATKARDKAKTASTNRGVQVGVSRGGALTGVKDMQTSGKTTARLNKKLGGSKLARKIHDHPKSQKVQKAFVPHHREAGVDPATHEKVKGLRRKRNHEIHAADRESQRRAQAYVAHNDQHVKDAPAEVTAAAERAPKGATPDFHWRKVQSDEHKEVKRTQRKERSAKRRAARQQSRANFETAQRSASTRKKIVDRFVARDRAVAEQDVKNIGHGHAVAAHADATKAQEKLGKDISKLEAIPRLKRTPKQASRLVKLKESHKAVTKFKTGLEAKWGTYAPGSAGRVDKKGNVRTPQRALKSVDASIQDLDNEIAPLEAKAAKARDLRNEGRSSKAKASKMSGPAGRAYKASGERKLAEGIASDLTKEEAAKLARLKRRRGQFHAERQMHEIEPHVTEYRKAGAAAKTTGIERGNARKAYRNAHGEDPIKGEKHPSSRRPVVGAPSLFTDKERDAIGDRWVNADAAHDVAKKRFDAATVRLEEEATKQAGKHAAGTPGVTPLRHLDRENNNTLRHLDDAKAGIVAATAERRAAEEKAKGVPSHVQKFLEINGVNGKGRPVSRPGARTWEDYLSSVPRHSTSELSPAGATMARQWAKDSRELRTELEKRGLIEGDLPDNYVHHMDSGQVSAAKQADIDEHGQPNRGAGRATKTGLTQHRTDPRPVKTQHEHGPEKFETDLSRIAANYIRNAKRAIADADYLKALKDVGRPAKSGGHVADNEAVYAFTPRGIKAVDEDKVHLEGKPGGEPGEYVVLPKAIGESEIRMRGGLKDTNIFGEMADEFNRQWKTAVTIYNLPFYQQRNLYDDTMRFWYGDGDLRSYGESIGLIGKARKIERAQRKLIPGTAPKGHVRIGRDRVPTDQFLKEAESDGILRGGAHANEFEHEGGSVNLRKKTPKREHVHNIGGIGEDIPRLATYLSARRRGMTRDQAREWTRVHHFDYTELTETERSLRRWIPFWTFTSRNVALQARTLATRPGKISQFQALREEMAKLSDLPPDWDTQYLDETQQKGMPIPIRWGTNKDGTPKIKLLFPSFSNTDLNRFPVGGSPKDITLRQWNMTMQMLSPFPKATLELFSNHSFFFNEAIYRNADHPEADRWVVAPPWVKDVPLLKHFIIDDYQDPHTGKATTGWPAWMNYMVRQFPQTGFIATVTTPSMNQRGQDAGDRWFGQLSGIRRTSLDKTKGEAGRLRNEKASLQMKMGDANDRVGGRIDKSIKIYPVNSVEYEQAKRRVAEIDKRLGQISPKPEQTPILSRPLSRPEQRIKQRQQRINDRSPQHRIDERNRKRAERMLRRGG